MQNANKSLGAGVPNFVQGGGAQSYHTPVTKRAAHQQQIAQLIIERNRGGGPVGAQSPMQYVGQSARRNHGTMHQMRNNNDTGGIGVVAGSGSERQTVNNINRLGATVGPQNQMIDGSAVNQHSTQKVAQNTNLQLGASGINGIAIKKLSMIDDAKGKFEKYLKLIFKDLCAKESGLTQKEVGPKVFLQYMRAQRLSMLLTKRLYEVMSTTQQSQIAPNQTESAVEKQLRQNNLASQAAGQGTSKMAAGATGGQQQQTQAQNNPQGGGRGAGGSGGISEYGFVKIILGIYYGTEADQREIAYRLMDTQNRGQISRNDLRIFLTHVLSSVKPGHQSLENTLRTIIDLDKYLTEVKPTLEESQIKSRVSNHAQKNNLNESCMPGVSPQNQDGNLDQHKSKLQEESMTQKKLQDQLKGKKTAQFRNQTEQKQEITIPNGGTDTIQHLEAGKGLKTEAIEALLRITFRTIAPPKTKKSTKKIINNAKLESEAIFSDKVLRKERFLALLGQKIQNAQNSMIYQQQHPEESKQGKKSMKSAILKGGITDNTQEIYIFHFIPLTRIIIDYLRLMLPTSWLFEKFFISCHKETQKLNAIESQVNGKKSMRNLDGSGGGYSMVGDQRVHGHTHSMNQNGPRQQLGVGPQNNAREQSQSRFYERLQQQQQNFYQNQEVGGGSKNTVNIVQQVDGAQQQIDNQASNQTPARVSIPLGQVKFPQTTPLMLNSSNFKGSNEDNGGAMGVVINVTDTAKLEGEMRVHQGFDCPNQIYVDNSDNAVEAPENQVTHTIFNITQQAYIIYQASARHFELFQRLSNNTSLKQKRRKSTKRRAFSTLQKAAVTHSKFRKETSNKPTILNASQMKKRENSTNNVKPKDSPILKHSRENIGLNVMDYSSIPLAPEAGLFSNQNNPLQTNPGCQPNTLNVVRVGPGAPGLLKFNGAAAKYNSDQSSNNFQAINKNQESLNRLQKPSNFQGNGTSLLDEEGHRRMGGNNMQGISNIRMAGGINSSGGPPDAVSPNHPHTPVQQQEEQKMQRMPSSFQESSSSGSKHDEGEGNDGSLDGSEGNGSSESDDDDESMSEVSGGVKRCKTEVAHCDEFDNGSVSVKAVQVTHINSNYLRLREPQTSTKKQGKDLINDSRQDDEHQPEDQTLGGIKMLMHKRGQDHSDVTILSHVYNQVRQHYGIDRRAYEEEMDIAHQGANGANVMKTKELIYYGNNHESVSNFDGVSLRFTGNVGPQGISFHNQAAPQFRGVKGQADSMDPNLNRIRQARSNTKSQDLVQLLNGLTRQAQSPMPEHHRSPAAIAAVNMRRTHNNFNKIVGAPMMNSDDDNNGGAGGFAILTQKNNPNKTFNLNSQSPALRGVGGGGLRQQNYQEQAAPQQKQQPYQRFVSPHLQPLENLSLNLKRGGLRQGAGAQNEGSGGKDSMNQMLMPGGGGGNHTIINSLGRSAQASPVLGPRNQGEEPSLQKSDMAQYENSYLDQALNLNSLHGQNGTTSMGAQMFVRKLLQRKRNPCEDIGGQKSQNRDQNLDYPQKSSKYPHNSHEEENKTQQEETVQQLLQKRMDECYMNIIEGRRLTLLKEVKRHGRANDPSWQVFFLPQGNMLKQKAKASSLYFKIQGPDLYAYKDEALSKVIFIHFLPGCEFSISEDKSPSTFQQRGSGAKKSSAAAECQSMRKSRVMSDSRGGLTKFGQGALASGHHDLQQPRFQIKIKISEGHKRVFYLREEDDANDIMFFLERSGAIYTPRRVMDPQDRYEQLGDYHQSLLGEGSYGKVYRALDKLSNKKVAIKSITMGKLSDQEESLMLQEIELCYVLQEDKHTAYAELIDVFEDEAHNLNIVMELFESKSLYQWMKTDLTRSTQRVKDVQTVFSVACDALMFAHNRGIIHRDIKLDNFLVAYDAQTQSYKTKIIDFGLATVNFSYEKCTLMVGSIAYLSPEIVYKQPYDYKTDVWSMGVALYTLLTGKLPFLGDNVDKTIENIKNKEINFDQSSWKEISYTAKDLVLMMLQKDDQKRLGMQKVIEHRWIKNALTNNTAAAGSKQM